MASAFPKHFSGTLSNIQLDVAHPHKSCRRRPIRSVGPRCSSSNSTEGPSTKGSPAGDIRTAEAVDNRTNDAEPSLAEKGRDSEIQQKSLGPRRQADSTDWVSSQLTRRFGIGGGLAWLAILTVGVVGEQIKTRLEEQAEKEGTKEVEGPEVVLPGGLRYEDVKIGGGVPPSPGYLVVVNYRGEANGVVYEDTWERGKPIVFLFGSRPFAGGMCAGLETALSSMHAGGVRRVTVPPSLAFGDAGTVLRPTEHVPDKQGLVPGGATLNVLLELKRVSIPPS